MKLWQKTTLVCIVVLLAVVIASSAVLLILARQNMLRLTREQAQAKQLTLAVSFSEMSGYYLTDTDSEAVRLSLLNYCFTRFADTSSVLVKDGESLCSSVRIDPVKYLPLQEEQQTFEGEIDGRTILIVGSPVTIRDETYGVYVVEDISNVYHSIVVMVGIFAVISLIGIILGAGTVTLLIRRGLRPLSVLSAVSKRIAGGAYDMRAEICTADEIGALAQDFNTMADAIQSHIAELSETAERQRLFVGGVTHEFKTPLTAMLLHTRLLQQAYMTENERTASLAHIEAQCLWLEHLTQTLLKVITLRQDITVTEIPVQELLHRVQVATQDLLRSRNTELVIRDDDSDIAVDIDLMQSLLSNLVDNASKAYDTDASSRTVWLSAHKNILEVRDEGRGIPEDVLPHIFEPFYVVDKSRSKKEGGSGLGLALVKQIADVHGAQLEVESSLRWGTTVRVMLKLQKN